VLAHAVIFVVVEILIESCVAALSSLLLSRVRSRCQFLRSLLFSSIVCLISMGQLLALGVAVFLDFIPACLFQCLLQFQGELLGLISR
jgi:hypothetical protein